MSKALNPAHIAPPYKNRYSHAIEVSAASRMLFVSGTVGVKPDGTVPSEFSGFVTPQGDIPTFAQVRERYFHSRKPAMTVVWVAGLADPRWMVEVELVVAK
ncbi:MAG TPA: hypothetical protein VHG88_07885 [Burkholderiales bacterium]|nr:hypothetical protein [Burkholderiales bacterium]